MRITREMANGVRGIFGRLGYALSPRRIFAVWVRSAICEIERRDKEAREAAETALSEDERLTRGIAEMAHFRELLNAAIEENVRVTREARRRASLPIDQERLA